MTPKLLQNFVGQLTISKRDFEKVNVFQAPEDFPDDADRGGNLPPVGETDEC